MFTGNISDAWAGKNIGIRIDSVVGTGDGYWDMDNVRLVSMVPEPGAFALGVRAALVVLGGDVTLVAGAIFLVFAIFHAEETPFGFQEIIHDWAEIAAEVAPLALDDLDLRQRVAAGELDREQHRHVVDHVEQDQC